MKINKLDSKYLQPELLNKRKEILLRDSYRCFSCKTTTNLQVHHKYYLKDREIWDYPNTALITLCKDCHKQLHDSIPINHFSKLL
jgi:5-methylcytosine-specific restriction endonuclease McrA